LISVGSEVQILPGPPNRVPGIGHCWPDGVRPPAARWRSLWHGSLVWGRSSAGRAPALQAGGHRFDPGRLQKCEPAVCILVMQGPGRYRGKFEFGAGMCLGKASRVCACAVWLVFVSVNQVLVRLWTRVPGTGSGAMACVTGHGLRRAAPRSWPVV
jgi:hypothetical protein